MSSLPGYHNLRLQGQTSDFVYFTATRTSDGLPVTLKQLRAEIAAPELVNRLRREYSLLNSLNSGHVVSALDFFTHNDAPILVLRRDTITPLRELINSALQNLEEQLTVAVSIANALDYLHSQSIIHKNLNPDTILVNKLTGDVTIQDFSIASLGSGGRNQSLSTALPEGNLAYISPEQTGRVNRTTDYRSDFYSLGVLDPLANSCSGR